VPEIANGLRDVYPVANMGANDTAATQPPSARLLDQLQAEVRRVETLGRMDQLAAVPRILALQLSFNRAILTELDALARRTDFAPKPGGTP